MNEVEIKDLLSSHQELLESYKKLHGIHRTCVAACITLRTAKNKYIEENQEALSLDHNQPGVTPKQIADSVRAVKHLGFLSAEIATMQIQTTVASESLADVEQEVRDSTYALIHHPECSMDLTAMK